MNVKIEGSSGVGSDDDSVVIAPLFEPYETTCDLPKSNSEQNFDVPAEAAQPKPPVRQAPGV